MESGESIPKEETKPEDLPLPEDDPFETTSYNEHWNDFLKQFETYKTNEYKMENYPDTFKNLPTIDPIRDTTISKLKEIREDIYDNLYSKYFTDDLERQKLISNKDSYKPFDSPNEDIKDFIELSKNISQLEKGNYTETNKELMFILGEKETTPTKDTLKRILDYLKDKKYAFLFTLFAATLIGLFVDVEKQLNKAQKAIKKQLVQQLVKHLKDELQVQLLKTANDIRNNEKISFTYSHNSCSIFHYLQILNFLFSYL